MRKVILMLVAVAALLVPLAALADDAVPAPSTVASQICKQERASMGDAAFKLLYGTNANRSNAYGKCVSKNASAAKQDIAVAVKACKAERTADPAAFSAKYGTNPNKSNAYGKCVSAQAKDAADEQAAETSSAAKSCKADRKADPAAFAAKYGSARNAFGKCVAAKSK